MIASLTDDELNQLRERISDSDAHDAADRRFARNLFGGSDDDEDQDDGADQDASEYTEEQRQWAKDLFATLDDDNDDVLAGLKSGRTIGRTTPPTREPIPHNEFRFS
ncbi:RNA polymerase subunit sigma [Mycobacterium gallinarum]|uniref:RNA polymerase subunit sigma n=1 Tax=Mycobacterium gallinarum TaxID=39689 RepID=UPI001E3A39F7|nr:RNA polymerase subunit sigma [Mycobacterium gallinarum]